MKTLTSPAYWVKIYITGSYEVIAQACRRECLRQGLCVTIDSTTFIYTGGEETGCCVGLIQYPRFEQAEEAIWQRAEDLALTLLDATCQHSVLVMSPTFTKWVTKRES
jgi:hypothetical protein